MGLQGKLAKVDSTGTNSIALGGDAVALANSISIGYGANTNEQSVGIGYGVNIPGNASVAIGANVTSNSYSISIGKLANTINRGVAIGYNVKAGSASTAGPGHIAIGFNVNASGSGSIAIGNNIPIVSPEGVVIGHNISCTRTSYDYDNVAIGQNLNFPNNKNSIIIGTLINSFRTDTNGNVSSTDNVIAIGTNIYAENCFHTAITLGANTHVIQRGIAIGYNSFSSGIAIGPFSYGAGGIAIGSSSYGYSRSLAIGSSCKVSNGWSVGIGYYTNCCGVNCVVIGSNAYINVSTLTSTNAYANNSIVIGTEANATRNNSVVIGVRSGSNEENSVLIGPASTSAFKYTTGVGSTTLPNANYATALGAFAKSTGTHSVAIGYGSNSSNSNSISLGAYAKAFGDNSIAIGTNVAITGNSASIVLGANAQSIYSHGGVGIGYGAVLNNSNYAVVIGYMANSIKTYGVAVGGYAQTDILGVSVGYGTVAGNCATALGSQSYANGYYSLTLGIVSHANYNYSYAIGYNAHTTRANSFMFGDAGTEYIYWKGGTTLHSSDKRDKIDIEEIPNGATEFLDELTPIKYKNNFREVYLEPEKWTKIEKNDIIIDEEEEMSESELVCNLSEEEREKRAKYFLGTYDKEAWAAGTKKSNISRMGVIAQDVLQALEDVYGSSDAFPLVHDNLDMYTDEELPEDVERQYSLDYILLIPFLIKSILELNARIKILEEKLNE